MVKQKRKKSNRRSFLKNSLKATTAVAFLPSIPQISFQGMTPLNKKSLKWGMIEGDMSVLEKFQRAKEVGFDGIELNSPDDLDDNEVMDAMAETKLVVPGLVNSKHWEFPLSDPEISVRNETIDSMKNALQRAKKLGATTVLLVPAVVSDEVSYQDAYHRSQEAIREILPVAEETGVKIAIENVWNNFLLSPLEAARYIDEFESNAIGWYMDVGNIVRYGWPEQWIRTLGERILKIDIKEYSRTKQQEEGIWKGFQVGIGDGDCNWPAVNKALSEIGYSGWGSAEVGGGDKKRLLDISKRMDRIYKL